MRIGWAVNIEGGVIGFRRPGRSGVAHERDVEAEFHSDAPVASMQVLRAGPRR